MQEINYKEENCLKVKELEPVLEIGDIYRLPTILEITQKLNELICNFNILVEVVSNERDKLQRRI